MFEKVIVIDCKAHLLGRLASTIAKELLNGQRIVCVRTEETNISGSLFRNKLKYHAFLNKKVNHNPRKGHYHYRSPARILWRTIRGMLPHKTPRGAVALDRLKVFEGIPHPFDKVKRQVIPQAMKVLRLRPGRKFCRLGDLASQVGWHHNDLIKKLEEKRKLKASAYWNTKKEVTKLRLKAVANVSAQTKTQDEQLSQLGH